MREFLVILLKLVNFEENLKKLNNFEKKIFKKEEKPKIFEKSEILRFFGKLSRKMLENP